MAVKGPGLIAVAAALAAIAGCGGSHGSDDAAPVPGGADPEAARVIDDWANALREDGPEAAAQFFAVPSIAQNGTPPLHLDSEREVVVFNASLPCGADLVRAEDHGGFVLATFELTERPGPGECGSGVGQRAQTAFRIEDGKIAEWRRAPNPGAEPAPPGQVVWATASAQAGIRSA